MYSVVEGYRELYKKKKLEELATRVETEWMQLKEKHEENMNRITKEHEERMKQIEEYRENRIKLVAKIRNQLSEANEISTRMIIYDNYMEKIDKLK